MPGGKSVWLTYAWDDNTSGDVDFAAQELQRAGLEVKLDRWNLTAGRRLWEQIEFFIQEPTESDGWLLYATQASLGSQNCREEYAYALDRALATRGGDFPIIALFPAPVDRGLLPSGIKTRLFVSLTEPDWKERIVAAVERRAPLTTQAQVEPYALTVHELGEEHPHNRFAIEVRPRAGTWAPFIAAIPLHENDQVCLALGHGPCRRVPKYSVLFMTGEGVSLDGEWWTVHAQNEATPTQSYYVYCKRLPSRLLFGVNHGPPQFEHTF